MHKFAIYARVRETRVRFILYARSPQDARNVAHQYPGFRHAVIIAAVLQ